MRIFEVTKKRSKLWLVLGGAVAVLGIAKGFNDFAAGNAAGAISAMIGIFILIIIFYSTIREITEEGVDEISSFLVFKKHNFWKWNEINTLFADFRKQPPYVLIGLKKENKRRQVRIDRDHVERIMYWAAQGNPDMTILHNNDCKYESQYAQIMTVSEHRETHESDYRPRTFHEFAKEMRKIKRERLLIRPDIRKVKIKKPKKKLEGWK